MRDCNREATGRAGCLRFIRCCWAFVSRLPRVVGEVVWRGRRDCGHSSVDGPAAASAGSITLNGNGTFTVQWLVVNDPRRQRRRELRRDQLKRRADLAITQVRNTPPTTPDIDAPHKFQVRPFAGCDGATNQVDGAIFGWGFSNFPGFGTVDVRIPGSNCAGGGGNLDQARARCRRHHPFTSTAAHADGVTFAPFTKFQTANGSFEVDDACIAGTVHAVARAQSRRSNGAARHWPLAGVIRFRRKAAK